MEKETTLLIKNGMFNAHKNNFFLHFQKYENQIIMNELPSLANQFLDIQATKEKESKQSVEIVNKRNYKDFINTSRNFLINNFNYMSSKYYIYFTINNISGQLSTSFEQNLNYIINNLINKPEIKDLITDCFFKKFTDFENNVKTYYKSNNIYGSPYEEEDEKPWMENFSKISYKNEKDSFFDDIETKNTFLNSTQKSVEKRNHKY